MKAQRTLPNGVVTAYQYNLRDQLTNIVHSKSGVVIAAAGYERQGLGEPAKITREDGSSVLLAYDAAHRLIAEVHVNAAQQIVETIAYGYDAAGNRTNRVVNGSSAAYGYLPGHRLSSVTGAESQGFTWDAGGRVAAITRDGETLALGYNSEDRLTSVSDGVATMNYTYDAQGRRVKSTVGSTERRFLVAPTLAGDLESPWLVADGNNAVLAGYAYAGAYPLMRFDASGVPTYYLEDAMHSVIGTADGAGLPVAHFHYDGFGNVRAAAGDTSLL